MPQCITPARVAHAPVGHINSEAVFGPCAEKVNSMGSHSMLCCSSVQEPWGIQTYIIILIVFTII